MSFKQSIHELHLGPAFHMEDVMENSKSIPVSLWKELESLSPLIFFDHDGGGDTNSQQQHPRKSGQVQWHQSSLSKPNKRRVEILTKILLGEGNDEKDSIKNNKNGNNNEGRLLPLFNSTMDFPTCIYFRDVIEVYKNLVDDPREVKVVLTTRNSGVDWAKSAMGTILNWNPSVRPFGMTLSVYTVPIIWRVHTTLGPTFNRYFPTPLPGVDNKTLERTGDYLSDFHDNWNSYVRSTMAQYAKENKIELKEVFLEFQVKQGWEPLCKFLLGSSRSDSCPYDKPYPHVNEKEKFKQDLFYINIFGYVWVMIITSVAYYTIRYLWLLIQLLLITGEKQETEKKIQ